MSSPTIRAKDVVTSLELERLMNAAGPNRRYAAAALRQRHIRIQSYSYSASAPAATDERGKPYCSKICCMYTAKHAMLIREKYPDTDVYVFYIDVRTPG